MDKASPGSVRGNVARRIGQVFMGRPVIAAIAGLTTFGWTFANLASRYWPVGELIVLAACILLVRESTTAYGEDSPVSVPDNSSANSRAWCAGSAAWYEGSATHRSDPGQQPFNLRDFGPPVPGSGPVNVDPHAMVSRPGARATMSVEQIGHEMLTHAFRQASLKHHSDHGGDPENMRRVYVVRDLFARAIQKT